MSLGPSLAGITPQNLGQSMVGTLGGLSQVAGQNLANQGQSLSNQTAAVNLQTLGTLNQQKVAYNNLVNQWYGPQAQAAIGLQGAQANAQNANATYTGAQTGAQNIINKNLQNFQDVQLQQAKLANQYYPQTVGTGLLKALGGILPSASPLAGFRNAPPDLKQSAAAALAGGQPNYLGTPTGGLINPAALKGLLGNFGMGGLVNSGQGNLQPPQGQQQAQQGAQNLPLSSQQQANLQQTFNGAQNALSPQQIARLQQLMPQNVNPQTGMPTDPALVNQIQAENELKSTPEAVKKQLPDVNLMQSEMENLRNNVVPAMIKYSGPQGKVQYLQDMASFAKGQPVPPEFNTLQSFSQTEHPFLSNAIRRAQGDSVRQATMNLINGATDPSKGFLAQMNPTQIASNYETLQGFADNTEKNYRAGIANPISQTTATPSATFDPVKFYNSLPNNAQAAQAAYNKLRPTQKLLVNNYHQLLLQQQQAQPAGATR